MADEAKQTIESDQDALEAGTTVAELWLKKIERALDDEKTWREEAKEAVCAYEAAEDKQPVAFNIFHSNIETLIPALYNSSPVPDVRRRFGDADPVAKLVVDISERAISYSIDQYDINEAFVSVIRDAAVTGRGILRVRYIANANGYQETTCERWPWDKFIRGPARSWAKMPWVAFEHDLTKDELAKINPKKAGKASLGETGDAENDKDRSKDPTGILNTLKVYEIWDAASRKVYFIDVKKEVWRVQDDPMQLPDFFPVMKPLQPVQRPSSLTPVCQYKVYKPLLDELDAVTKRISRLVKQLRVRGLIDAEMAADFEAIKTAEDGQYAPAKNAAMFAGSGGLEKAIAHWPMDPIVKALQQLYMQRDSIKQTIYEVTGISDILRGASDANETATAQNIKNQWGSLRIQRLQAEVADMAREMFRAKVALFAKHFSDENIQMMTCLPGEDDQQIWPQAMELFRSDVRSFRIDIETDSTIRADMTRNQEAMNNFLAGTGQFAQAMAGIIQIPQIGQASIPVMVEIYTAFARKFKLGKQAEDALDGLSSAVQQMAQQPQEEQPDPEAEKIKMQMQAEQQKAQLAQQTMEAKAAHDERMAQLAEKKARMDIEIKTIELQMKQQEMALNMQAKQAELQMKSQSMAMQAEADHEARELDSQERRETFAMNREERRSGVEMMHEKNEAQRQGMADKAKFQKQQMKAKQDTRPSA